MADDEITSIIADAAADLSEAEAPAASAAPESPPVESPASEMPAASEAARTPADAAAAPATPAPAAAAPAASPSKAEAAIAPDEAAELSALEQELVAKDPRLAHARKMPALRHTAIVHRLRRQYEGAMAEAAKKIEAAKQYEAPEFRDRLTAFQIAERNPDQFLQILQAIPAYKTRLDALVEAALATRAPAAPPPPVPPVEEAEPAPDTLLEGGGMGYSTERANQLWEYRLRQARKEYDAKLAKLEEGIKPIQQERQTRERIEQAYTRTGQQLADARTNWPLFKEYEPKIREELAKPGNERMQLDQAYRVVVVAAERADRTRIETETRAKIQQELNGHAQAPRSLRPTLPPAQAARSEGSDEIDAIIRDAARSLG